VSRTTALTRRRMLQAAAGVGGGLAFAGLAQGLGLRAAQAQLQDAQDSPQTILNLAATAEALAITAYYHAIASNPLGASGDTLSYLKLALSAEQYHLAFLQSAGAELLTNQFYLPEAFFTEAAAAGETLVALETAFAAAYLAATRRFAELGEARLAATTAQHAASEVEHLALARLAGGSALANPNGLPAPIYYNVSDAVPTLVPFIQGATGFTTAIGLPGPAAVQALLDGVQAVPVPTFTQVF
jgi:hypothetical protein